VGESLKVLFQITYIYMKTECYRYLIGVMLSKFKKDSMANSYSNSPTL
jgi:hypothetical protein